MGCDRPLDYGRWREGPRLLADPPGSLVTRGFCTWATSNEALRRARDSGALSEIEDALLRAYAATETAPKGRLRPSMTVERELRRVGWKKATVAARNELACQGFLRWAQDAQGRYDHRRGSRVALASSEERPTEVLARQSTGSPGLRYCALVRNSSSRPGSDYSVSAGERATGPAKRWSYNRWHCRKASYPRRRRLRGAQSEGGVSSTETATTKQA